MRQTIRLLSYGALLMLLGGAVVAQAADDDREASETCAVCHDEIAAEFELTVHSPNRADAPSCVSCHGDGADHIDQDGDLDVVITQVNRAPLILRNDEALGHHTRPWEWDA